MEACDRWQKHQRILTIYSFALQNFNLWNASGCSSRANAFLMLIFIFITEIAIFVSGIYETGSEDKSQAQQTNNAGSRSPQVSLSRIILSLESHVSKQQALQHVLNALQVLHAREAVVAALSSHSNIAGFASTGKPSVHSYSMYCSPTAYLSSTPWKCRGDWRYNFMHS
jgi:hypothetical protein